MTRILGILIEKNKGYTVRRVQEVLSEFCCAIRTRLGINSYDEGECSSRGIILIDVPKGEKADEIRAKLEIIQNVTVKEIDF